MIRSITTSDGLLSSRPITCMFTTTYIYIFLIISNCFLSKKSSFEAIVRFSLCN